jgi:hypothetical protein
MHLYDFKIKQRIYSRKKQGNNFLHILKFFIALILLICFLHFYEHFLFYSVLPCIMTLPFPASKHNIELSFFFLHLVLFQSTY